MNVEVQALIDFAKDAKDLVDEDALLATLDERAPSIFRSSATRFRLWLDSQGKIKLNNVIERGMAAAANPSEGSTLEVIRNEVEQTLRSTIASSTSRELHGPYPHPETVAVMNSPHLVELLTFLAIKRMPKDDTTTVLLQEWINKQESSVEQRRVTVAQLAEELKAEAEISNEDIQGLIRMAKIDGTHDDFIFQRKEAYGILLNALLLDRLNALDMSSPVFQSFLKDFIGRVEPSAKARTGQVVFTEAS
jgi:hypothetical protein